MKMKLWRKRRLWAMWIFNASYFSPCACFLMGRTAFLAPASPSFSLLTSKALPDATPRFTKLDGSNSARGFRNNISPSSKSSPVKCADTNGNGRHSQSNIADSWISTVNQALEQSAVATLMAFVGVDLGSAMCLLVGMIAFNVQVNADFALAYALSKSVRAPRLALDASCAAFLVRIWPALKLVKMSLVLDEVGAAWGAVRGRVKDDSESSTSSPSSSFAKASAQLRRLTDEYGLAYMAAKNVIGPVSILLIYAAISTSYDVHGMLVKFGSSIGFDAETAGVLAGQMALASTTSTILFPAVIYLAALLGPRIQALFPNVR